MTYADFLAEKVARVHRDGLTVDTGSVHPTLHDWQAEIVVWALGVGRAAIWADTGLGKTFMQIEWLRHASGDGTGLIVAPLAICQQTIREAAKLGVTITCVREQPSSDGLYITNCEMVDKINPATLTAVVLDEASILKSSDGKMRALLIALFAAVPYRLACTATPAPNDPEELTNQAEFLGHMSRTHMLAAYFVHDDQGWRLKGHARRPMYQWMATWAVAIRKPSDMGYDDDGYDLPGLQIIPQHVHVPMEVEDQLFATDLGGVGGRAKVRRETLDARVGRAVELVNDSHGTATGPASPLTTATRPAKSEESDTSNGLEPWIVWCGLNDEQDAVAKALGPRAFSITGSMAAEQKVDLLYRWLDGERPVLVSKATILGAGINMQHCARMIFVGMSDSYETYYQAIRRCHRYGQTRIVHAHIVLSELEQQIASNVARKERDASRITAALVSEMRHTRAQEAS